MSEHDAIRACVEAATPGPWQVDGDGWIESVHPFPYITSVVRAEGLVDADKIEMTQPNAVFIARSRTDVPLLLDENAKLRAALDAVTTLHYADADTEDVIPQSCVDGPCEHDDECPELTITPCYECSRPGEYYIEWPCPTVRAITEALA